MYKSRNILLSQSYALHLYRSSGLCAQDLRRGKQRIGERLRTVVVYTLEIFQVPEESEEHTVRDAPVFQIAFAEMIPSKMIGYAGERAFERQLGNPG